MSRRGAALRRAVVLVHPDASIVVLTWLAGLCSSSQAWSFSLRVSWPCVPSVGTHQRLLPDRNGPPFAVVTRGGRCSNRRCTTGTGRDGITDGITWSGPARLR